MQGFDAAARGLGPQSYAAPLNAIDELRVVARDDAIQISTAKQIVDTDPYLAVHFPGCVIYPGVFVLETVRQAVLAAMGERDGRLPDLSAVCSMRLRTALRPGERLEVTADLVVPYGPAPIAVRASCRRGDGTDVATLVLEFTYDS